MYKCECDDYGWNVLFDGYALYKGLTDAEAHKILEWYDGKKTDYLPRLGKW